MCTRCVMDTTDPDIVFDEHGVCNHCKTASQKLKDISFRTDEERKIKLNEIVVQIKKAGKDKKYNCIIGLSGGVDSSYLAYVVVKELGLKPLAVHVDNGWNSELAVQNIENIVKKLNIDLVTWVIDWEEFKDLQRAYLRASVIDLEVISDNAIVIAIDKLLRKNKINYFLIGHNYQAESVMPASWFYTPKYDGLNIRSIYKQFGSGLKLKTFPTLNLIGYIRYRYFNKTIAPNFLDLVPYKKKDAINTLVNELGWRDYGGKHYESKITRFYQAYILPTKFNVDKRKAHLSSLINSNQISREEALLELNKPLYPTPQELEADMEYFLKKLDLMSEDFKQIMQSKIRPHFEYAAYNFLFYKLAMIKRKFKRW